MKLSFDVVIHIVSFLDNISDYLQFRQLSRVTREILVMINHKNNSEILKLMFRYNYCDKLYLKLLSHNLSIEKIYDIFVFACTNNRFSIVKITSERLAGSGIFMIETGFLIACKLKYLKLSHWFADNINRYILRDIDYGIGKITIYACLTGDVSLVRKICSEDRFKNHKYSQLDDYYHEIMEYVTDDITYLYGKIKNKEIWTHVLHMCARCVDGTTIAWIEAPMTYFMKIGNDEFCKIILNEITQDEFNVLIEEFETSNDDSQYEKIKKINNGHFIMPNKLA